MVTPDKTTIYKEWTEDKRVQYESIIPKLASARVRYLDLRTPLLNGVSNGVRDVYLPNDTHWGSSGAKIVAEELSRYIQEP
jgi:hypothetical protein